MLTPWIIFRNRQISHLAHVDALDGPIIHFCRIYLSFNSLRADICAQHSHCCLIIPSMYNVYSPTGQPAYIGIHFSITSGDPLCRKIVAIHWQDFESISVVDVHALLHTPKRGASRLLT
jgi:hypothetical protein